MISKSQILNFLAMVVLGLFAIGVVVIAAFVDPSRFAPPDSPYYWMPD